MAKGGGVFSNIMSQDRRSPGTGNEERSQDLDRGSLSRPIRPKQAEQLPVLDLERDTVQRHDVLPAAPEGSSRYPEDMSNVVKLYRAHPIFRAYPRIVQMYCQAGLTETNRLYFSKSILY